jgi:trehalose 6-phosphate synthase
MLLPKMLRLALEGKEVIVTGSLDDQAKMFRQGKGRSTSSASQSSAWRTGRSRKQSYSAKVGEVSVSPPKFQSKTNVTIGFFLHTPFPSSEIFRCVEAFLSSEH